MVFASNIAYISLSFSVAGGPASVGSGQSPTGTLGYDGNKGAYGF